MVSVFKIFASSAGWFLIDAVFDIWRKDLWILSDCSNKNTFWLLRHLYLHNGSWVKEKDSQMYVNRTDKAQHTKKAVLAHFTYFLWSRFETFHQMQKLVHAMYCSLYKLYLYNVYTHQISWIFFLEGKGWVEGGGLLKLSTEICGQSRVRKSSGPGETRLGFIYSVGLSWFQKAVNTLIRCSISTDTCNFADPAVQVILLTKLYIFNSKIHTTYMYFGGSNYVALFVWGVIYILFSVIHSVCHSFGFSLSLMIWSRYFFKVQKM